jgi:hypothetical protein
MLRRVEHMVGAIVLVPQLTKVPIHSRGTLGPRSEKLGAPLFS